jgi:hypothetical protein
VLGAAPKPKNAASAGHLVALRYATRENVRPLAAKGKRSVPKPQRAALAHAKRGSIPAGRTRQLCFTCRRAVQAAMPGLLMLLAREVMGTPQLAVGVPKQRAEVPTSPPRESSAEVASDVRKARRLAAWTELTAPNRRR